MEQKQIFRKVSLERLVSPERLDTLMQITSPRNWIVLATIFVLLMGAVLWSVLAKVPVKVSGQGIMNLEPLVVLAPTDGRVEAVLVSTGGVVQANQALATFIDSTSGETITLTSPSQGVIAALNIAADAEIRAAMPVAVIQPIVQTNIPLSVVVYVTFLDAQKVKPGMEVFVSPIVVSQQEHGYMRAEVVSVGAFPVNNEFTQGAFPPGTPVVEVRVKLHTAATPTGYEWTVADGPPLPLRSGTPCLVEIIIKEERPISWVLPVVEG